MLPQSFDSQTPMMKQYFEIKNQYQDSVLLYRMGDFYELFYDDAVRTASILGVALTRRGKQEGQDIPMCGVPYHSVDIYIKKLINAGFKVAICDQLESPEEAKKRGYKSVVKRDVTRVITKGTLIEDWLLEDKISNYLASIVIKKNEISVAYVDISTLEFKVLSLDEGDLENFIVNLNPAEVIIQDRIIAEAKFANVVTTIKDKLVNFVDSFFEEKKCYEKLKYNFDLHTLDSLGNFTSTQISACGSIIEYLSITQKQEKLKLNFPIIQDRSEYVIIDKSVQKNLELFSSGGEYGYSFVSVIDKTLTSVGGRLIRKYLAFPSNQISIISYRQKMIGNLLSDEKLLNDTRNVLRNIPDLERALSRLISSRGSAKDLYSLYDALCGANHLVSILDESNINDFISLKDSLKQGAKVCELLDRLLIKYDLYLNQGNFINPDYNEEYKELYNLKLQGNQLITQLRDEYRQKTGVHSLKLEFNNVLGYYIEVSKINISKITSDEFIHRQTMINANRYVTNKLKELEGRLLSLNSSLDVIKERIFNEVIEFIYLHKENLYNLSNIIALIDVICSFAYLAKEQNYTCPIINDSNDLYIEEGRHPVVEHSLSQKGNDKFVANDCELEDSKKIWLITGPNMSGKSTFLRQNALIVILAHMGSYVPAKKASIGIVDRIFSRIGSGDDLARGYSTFLVEMLETAVILNQATKRSLVILDEIGRGTSTYDGIAIAWSCLEYIHDNIKCRTLFSTHYNELTELSSQLQNLRCYTVDVKEWNGHVIFLHKVVQGVADRSYGINVAEIAGVPKVVVSRAKEILLKLNENNYTDKKTDDLFSYHNRLELQDSNKEHEEYRALKEKFTNLELDAISPKQALDMLFKIKEDLVK